MGVELVTGAPLPHLAEPAANGGSLAELPCAARDGLADAWPSLRTVAIEILRTPCLHAKVRITAAAAKLWKSGQLPVVSCNGDCDQPVPDTPARPPDVAVVPKGRVKSGSIRAMLHGICHAESYAIDLMWDSVARFSLDDGEGGAAPPWAFFDEWVDIASDEARHFSGWAQHLEERYATRYGDLPTHDMLWEVAFATRHSLRARLAVVHLIHEARGLDVAPAMRARCMRSQDLTAASVLDQNIADEVRHVRAGVRWFCYLCSEEGGGGGCEPGAEFARLASAHYQGALKRPFNDEMRRAAELPETWYLPLAEAASANEDTGS
mmetsp:Transcript_76646/g.211741  ORF Transcript_76646/g.211741 Transcript_76646/m.211741 type:complete len:322 (+) Transcript_76646:54-1019(+)